MRKTKQTAPKASEPTPSAVQPAESEAPATAAKKAPRLSASLKAQADRMIATRDKKKTPTPRGARPPKVKEADGEADLVVFALRMSQEERELLHRAAGPARASRFARALLVAAACNDEGAIKLLLQNVQQATA